MEWINYNHFYYFWMVAKEMNVTRAAKKLRLSQSTLSEQIKQFQLVLGHSLFEKSKQRLNLTETGRIAFEYADHVFSKGEEMVGVLKGRAPAQRALIKVGAVGPLSKNFQYEFLQPLLSEDKVSARITTGSLKELTQSLANHTLDIVLSGEPIRSDRHRQFNNHLLAEVDVYMVSTQRKNIALSDLPRWLSEVFIFVPCQESRVRHEFESYLDRHRAKVKIKAEVEDMALLRVLALSGAAPALVPEIVVINELRDKKLHKIQKIPQVKERFYAITARRMFQSPAVDNLLKGFAKRLKKAL